MGVRSAGEELMTKTTRIFLFVAVGVLTMAVCVKAAWLMGIEGGSGALVGGAIGGVVIGLLRLWLTPGARRRA